MKKVIVALSLIASLSCSEKEDVAHLSDLFIGSWFAQISGQGVHIDVSFDVINYDKGEYTFKNIIVSYAEVPWNIVPSGLIYDISPEDKFAADDGFGQIDIWGTSDTMSVLIRLKYAKILKNNGGWTAPGGIPIDKSIPYVMTLSEVHLEKTNTTPILLMDQIFMRTK